MSSSAQKRKYSETTVVERDQKVDSSSSSPSFSSSSSSSVSSSFTSEKRRRQSDSSEGRIAQANSLRNGQGLVRRAEHTYFLLNCTLDGRPVAQENIYKLKSAINSALLSFLGQCSATLAIDILSHATSHPSTITKQPSSSGHLSIISSSAIHHHGLPDECSPQTEDLSRTPLTSTIVRVPARFSHLARHALHLATSFEGTPCRFEVVRASNFLHSLHVNSRSFFTPF